MSEVKWGWLNFGAAITFFFADGIVKVVGTEVKLRLSVAESVKVSYRSKF